MEAVVSDILQSRKREPEGLGKTALISLAVHAGAIAAMALLSAFLPSREPAPRVVMSISLGGTPGPTTGGTQMIGGQRMEAAPASTVAPPPIPRSVPVAPPTPPKMVQPDPWQKPRTPAPPPRTSKDPQGTERGRGFQTQPGTTRAATGAQGQGFGLSTGGGGGGGSRLDVGDFCCPEYVSDMVSRIRGNWNQQQPGTGVVFVKYTIQRNGQITDVEVETSSGNPILDLASQRALVTTRALPPLPAAYTQPTLTVHLEFRYERR